MGWACSSCGGDNPDGMRFCGHCGTPLGEVPPALTAEVNEALKSFVSEAVADQLLASAAARL